MAEPSRLPRHAYETGMRITFEPRSGRVAVRFRGRLTVLPGTFGTEAEAMHAGETYCRQRGWRPGPPRPVPPAILRSAW